MTARVALVVLEVLGVVALSALAWLLDRFSVEACELAGFVPSFIVSAWLVYFALAYGFAVFCARLLERLPRRSPSP